MELKETVTNRRSIRSFLDKPVEDGIIEEILSNALWAPSWGNTQPCEIIVTVGDALATFKAENKGAVISGKQPSPDIPMPQKWPKINKDRYNDLGRRTLEALGIPREDSDARLKYYHSMFELFDAPALILITVDKEISLEYSMLDAGILLQTICLLAHERGLGTCILAASVQYPDISRALFEIPDMKRIVMGVALGWPDPKSPVNTFERSRGELKEIVRWIK